MYQGYHGNNSLDVQSSGSNSNRSNETTFVPVDLAKGSSNRELGVAGDLVFVDCSPATAKTVSSQFNKPVLISTISLSKLPAECLRIERDAIDVTSADRSFGSGARIVSFSEVKGWSKLVR
jgi:hypothetical protein